MAMALKKTIFLITILFLCNLSSHHALGGSRYFDADGTEVTEKEYKEIVRKPRNRLDEKATEGTKPEFFPVSFDECISTKEKIDFSRGYKSGGPLYNLEGNRRGETFGKENHKLKFKKGRYSFKIPEVNIDKPYLEVELVRNVVSNSKGDVISSVPVQFVPVSLCFGHGDGKWAGSLFTDERGAVYIDMRLLADLVVYSAQPSGDASIHLTAPGTYTSRKTVQVDRKTFTEIYKKWNLDNFRFEINNPTFNKPYLTAKLVMVSTSDSVKEIGLDPTKNVPVTIQYLAAGEEKILSRQTDDLGQVRLDLRDFVNLVADKPGLLEFTFLAPEVYACRETVAISKKTLVSIRDRWTPDEYHFEFTLPDQSSKYLSAKLNKRVFSETTGKKIQLPAPGTPVSISYTLYGKEKVFAKRTDNNGQVLLDLLELAEATVYNPNKPKYKKINFHGPPKYLCSATHEVSSERLAGIYEKWTSDTFSFKITSPSARSPNLTVLLAREVQQDTEDNKKLLPLSNIPVSIRYMDAGREKEVLQKTDSKGKFIIGLCDMGRSFLYDPQAPEYVEYQISSSRPFLCKQKRKLYRNELLRLYQQWDEDGNLCRQSES